MRQDDRVGHLIKSAVDRAARVDPDWLDNAREALYDLARTGKPFTSEDVLHRAGLSIGDHRALGGLFRSARSLLVIAPTGRVVSARRPVRNGGLVREWVGLP